MSSTRVSLVSLSARTYLRYVVPLTILSLLVFAPLLLTALRVPPPGNPVQAKVALRTAWVLVALGVIPLLVLVGGVAPAVRALAGGHPRSQLAVLGAGLVGTLRALVPCLVAACAIAIGGLALVVPGVLLLVLFALTGASTEPGLPGPLTESVALARQHARTIACVLLVTITVAVAVVLVLRLRLPLPLPKKLAAADGAAIRQFVRVAALAVALVAPLPAVVLAAIHVRATRPG